MEAAGEQQGEDDAAQHSYSRAMALRKSSDVLAAWGLFLQNVRGDDGRAESLDNLSLMTNPTHLETLQNYAMLQERRDDLNKAERLYAIAVEANCAKGFSATLDDLKAPRVAAFETSFETSRTGVGALVKRVDCGKQGVGRSVVEGEFQKRQGESCEEVVRREMAVVGKGREKERGTQEDKRLRMEEKSQEKEKRVQTLAENTAGNNKDPSHWGVKEAGGVTLCFGGRGETRRWGASEIKQETAEQTRVQDAYTSACAHHTPPHAQGIKQEETAGQKGMHQLQHELQHQLQHERERACARERARERESDLDRIFQAAEKKMKNWGVSRSGGGGVSGPSTPRSSPPSSLSPKTKKLATPAESTAASPEALQKSAYATAYAPPRSSPPSSVSPDALQNSAYAAAYAASCAASYASASASYASACASGMALLSVESAQRDARGKACPTVSFSACSSYVLK